MTRTNRKLTTVRLSCDRCGAVRQGRIGQSLDTLRLQLRGIGWRSNSDANTDTCQACVAGRAPVQSMSVAQ